MRLTFPGKADFHRALSRADDSSLDFIVLAAGAFPSKEPTALQPILRECIRAMKKGGLLFVQGSPEYLPEIGVYLDGRLAFKYWIAVESAIRHDRRGLPSVHAGLLLFTKGDRFHIQQVRHPHRVCSSCGRSLRDWGGKTHLMHPGGRALSDIWRELPHADNYSCLSQSALEIVLGMVGEGSVGMIGPDMAGSHGGTASGQRPDDGVRESSPSTINYQPSTPLPSDLVNTVHLGDALEVLRRYPGNSVDLVFADPPYNLNKGYGVYEDGSSAEEYITWCEGWLEEYVRVLKPTGSLYTVNLPRWAMYHAAFLNKRLSFRNWIAWDALSEPRGKLMPAHYGLLFYTKHLTDFTFNYGEVGSLDDRRCCLRASCIRKRKLAGDDEKEPLTDIWSDIHRIRHRRDRDHHPCQLPDALMERIIRLSTKPGDIVLDALCGVGTTLVAAARLDRRYVGIDLDESYVEITRRKLAEVEHSGCVARQSISKPPRKYTKKQLQLELRNLAETLGRLPTPEDVRTMSEYDLSAFLELFPTWGKALKAAKLEVGNAVPIESCLEDVT